MATTQQTSAAGAGIGAVVGGMYGNPQAGAQAGSEIGAMFGNNPDGYNTYRSHMRKFTQQQFWAQRKHDRKRFVALRQGAEAAGLHPLAALGISPGAGTNAAPMVPGQSRSGSAISDAIKDVRADQLARQRLELDNALVHEQILASQTARAAQTANSAQDAVVTLSQLLAEPRNIGPKRRGIDFKVTKGKALEHATKETGYNLAGLIPIKEYPGRVRGQALADSLGEGPMEWVMQPINFMLDLAYTGGTSPVGQAAAKATPKSLRWISRSKRAMQKRLSSKRPKPRQRYTNQPYQNIYRYR